MNERNEAKVSTGCVWRLKCITYGVATSVKSMNRQAVATTLLLQIHCTDAITTTERRLKLNLIENQREKSRRPPSHRTGARKKRHYFCAHKTLMLNSPLGDYTCVKTALRCLKCRVSAAAIGASAHGQQTDPSAGTS